MHRIFFAILPLLIIIGVVIGIINPMINGTDSMNASGLQAQAQIVGDGINGTLILSQEHSGAVRIHGSIQGNPSVLPPGEHGIHFHAVGLCEAQTDRPFSSAGGHFDPGPFGSASPVEANHPFHSGDLLNLSIDQQGRGNYDVVTSRVTLTEGPLSLLDNDGTTILIHALQDQMKAGGTLEDAGGPRIACGVVRRS